MRNRVGTGQRDAECNTAVVADERSDFRRLRANELVWSSDYLLDGRLGLQLWDGPGGFQARTFTKPVYRMRAATVSPTASTRPSRDKRNNR